VKNTTSAAPTTRIEYHIIEPPLIIAEALAIPGPNQIARALWQSPELILTRPARTSWSQLLQQTYSNRENGEVSRKGSISAR
jgi:hypothetical protein